MALITGLVGALASYDVSAKLPKLGYYNAAEGGPPDTADVREVFRTQQFEETLANRLGNIETGLARLTDEQRAQVFDQDRPRTPEATLESLHAKYDATQPTRA